MVGAVVGHAVVGADIEITSGNVLKTDEHARLPLIAGEEDGGLVLGDRRREGQGGGGQIIVAMRRMQGLGHGFVGAAGEEGEGKNQ